ncbi:hypothetical protein J437_LFUL006852 [Ladona fulva]|uniref:Uncharacterized protein n=1 Tax=Ladona fulva TaxID=123851 RepID=A0A8K0KN43_LADFU|nr:hypothetical protein J437_LFUL006852 [Ladona fulva]
MSVKNVRKYCREFSEWWTTPHFLVHGEPRNGRPSLSDKYLVDAKDVRVGIINGTCNTNAVLDQFGWEILTPYSPDLVPLDFHLFLSPEKHSGGRRMDIDEEEFTCNALPKVLLLVGSLHEHGEETVGREQDDRGHHGQAMQ